MASLPNGQLSVAFDLNGCPNRCRHCWLGRATSRTMDLRQAVGHFQDWREHLASGHLPADVHEVRYFGSWFREPDYADNYRELYQTELRLNSNSRRADSRR